MRFLLFLSLTISLSVAIHDFVLEGAKNDFTGFKVYRVNPTTDEQLEFLHKMEHNSMVRYTLKFTYNPTKPLFLSFMTFGLR